ncbi:MAG: serine hydrolase [Patescibacteria group bacterium]
MRLTFVSLFILVFGFIFQQFVFLDNSEKTSEKNLEPKNITASVAEVVNLNQEQGDISINDDTEKEESQNLSNEISEKTPLIKSDFFGQDTNPNFLPIRDFSVSEVKYNAKSSIVVSQDGKILHKDNIDERLQIASLTKFLVGIIVTENLKKDDIITINESAILTDGISGRFKVGEKIKVENLLKIMLVVSSNDAAVAFSEHFKSLDINMIELMNKKMLELGLNDTNFSNPVGFDDPNNFSTTRDYADLVLYSLNNEWLWSVLSIKDEIIKSDYSDAPNRRIISSDKLIFKDIWGILGGKTGYTPIAGGCLMVVFEVEGKNGRPNSKAVSVIFGAKDVQSRFDEMEKLINWIRGAYIF